MKYEDIYKHFKGKKYLFIGVALPFKTFQIPQNINLTNEMVKASNIMYHENTHEVEVYTLWGTYLINSDIPHVIYQSEKDIGTDKRWAREIDDFFGYKEVDGVHVKKFKLIEEERKNEIPIL